MHFQAAVLHQTRTPLQIETVRLTELRPTDVLVQLHASGLCHTDLEVIEGDLPYPLPIVLGHEGAGIVEAIGSEVSHVKVGDPVICSWNPHCGLCFYCQRQQPILCEPFTRHQPAGHMLDGDSRYRLGNGSYTIFLWCPRMRNIAWCRPPVPFQFLETCPWYPPV